MSGVAPCSAFNVKVYIDGRELLASQKLDSLIKEFQIQILKKIADANNSIMTKKCKYHGERSM
jgi:hypothetical protein